jgi:hypothetical protein
MTPNGAGTSVQRSNDAAPLGDEDVDPVHDTLAARLPRGFHECRRRAVGLVSKVDELPGSLELDGQFVADRRGVHDEGRTSRRRPLLSRVHLPLGKEGAQTRRECMSMLGVAGGDTEGFRAGVEERCRNCLGSPSSAEHQHRRARSVHEAHDGGAVRARAEYAAVTND